MLYKLELVVDLVKKLLFPSSVSIGVVLPPDRITHGLLSRPWITLT